VTRVLETARLGDLCEIVRGSSPRPKGDPRYFGGTIPWVTIRDVTRADGRYLRETTETVTEAGRDRSRYVEPGQLIVSNSATIGFPIFMGVGGCIHDGFLTLLNLDDRVTLEWLYWYFLSARTSLAALAPEGTQKNLNIELVENVRIPLPSVRDQERRAEVLRLVDRLWRARRYAVNLSASFVDTAFRKRFGNKLEDGPFRYLGDLVKITGGGTPARARPDYFLGSIPWLTPKDVRGEYIWDTEEHITEEAIAKSATKLVSADSILVVVKSKALMRRLPIAVAKVPMCHGQDIKSIQCRDGFHHEFIRSVLKYHERHLLRLARGANTEGLTLTMLEELPVPDVEYAEQRAFASLVGRAEELRARQREALRQARHLFESLLHEAFPTQA
jgi:type I restriction enzyme S subunit